MPSWLEPIIGLLTKVLEMHGFSAFLVTVVIAVVIWYSVYILRRSEKLHEAEITRLVQIRDRLLEHALKDQIRSSEDLDQLVKEDPPSDGDSNA